MCADNYCCNILLSNGFNSSGLQNISLSVQPDAEIRACKKQLLQKAVLLNAAASAHKHNAVTTRPTKQGVAEAMESVLCVLWLAMQLLTTSASPKLRPDDLYFLHHGKPLDDDALWKDYIQCRSSNHKNTTTTSTATTTTTMVTVHPRVRGGCFMVSASVLAMLCTAVVASSCTCGMSLVAVPFLLPLLFVLPLFCL